MTTYMPLDDNSNVIPAIRLRPGAAHAVNATTGASARNSTAFDAQTKVVSLYATGAVYVRFGDSSVTAASTDHYYPTGVYYDFSLGGAPAPHYTHVAVRAAEADCTLYISEKE